MVDARVEHVDHRVDGDPLGREGHGGGDHEPPDGCGAGEVLGDELRAQVGIGDDPEPLAELDEDARDVGRGHEARRLGSGRTGRADDGRPMDGLELIRLIRSGAGVQVDRVAYDDDLPWPQETNGTGQSLARVPNPAASIA